MPAESYTKTGNTAATSAKLDKSIFGIKEVNHQLLKDAYLAHLGNSRENLAKTKNRSDVRGGGRKPWRQKGTGRARFGSSRNPIWTAGGVAFGPTGAENYKHKLNAKTKRSALKQALSLAAAEGRIKIVDSFNFADGRVKPVVALLDKLNVGSRTLLLVEQKDILAERATRNLPAVKLAHVNYLGVFDVLNADTIVITKKGLEVLQARLSAAGSQKTKAVKDE